MLKHEDSEESEILFALSKLDMLVEGIDNANGERQLEKCDTRCLIVRLAVP